MRQGCGVSVVSVWGAVRVVPVVRLIEFRFPGDGRLATAMEHRGGQDDDDGALPWLGGGPGPRAGWGRRCGSGC